MPRSHARKKDVKALVQTGSTIGTANITAEQAYPAFITRQPTLYDLLASDAPPPPNKPKQPAVTKKLPKTKNAQNILPGQQTLSALLNCSVGSQVVKRRVKVKSRINTGDEEKPAVSKATVDSHAASMLTLELSTMGSTWLPHLLDELQKPYFLKLNASNASHSKRLAAQASQITLCPPDELRYQWSRLTPLDQVKVVILGAQPYGKPAVDEGLAYSVRFGGSRTPEVDNIFIELARQIPTFVAPDHGNLTAWASRGVLLLNVCQSVQVGKTGATMSIAWERFTAAIIDVVTSRSNGVVFLAWGGVAIEQVRQIDRHKHLVLTSAHPSPSSAKRGFFGNDHFIHANEWLAERHGLEATIDWASVGY